MAGRPCRTLFLCTGNSARSILAECLLNRLGRGAYLAFSAGSRPKGAVHPEAVRMLQELGHDTAGLASKGWDVFAAPDAPPLDLVITVCDAAAGEICPIWPGAPLQAHWSIPDPAAADREEAPAAFRRAYRLLEARISRLAAIDPASLTRANLRAVSEPDEERLGVER
jgi:protein-tyrosine-phosphatase